MTHRVEQLGSTIRRAVQQVLLKGLADPRIQGSISVTSVKVSRDLRHATIFVSIVPEEKAALTMHGLRSAVKRIRHDVGDLVALARMPELSIKLDQSIKDQAAVLDVIARASRELAAKDNMQSSEAADEVASESPTEVDP